jgi:carbamoyl-phosphate synthase small subunit
MKAVLVLEDGSSYEGTFIGAAKERIGEVVLNTGVVGYQEAMSDPANAGKILVFTYPLIGNYGVAKKFYESGRCWIKAVVMKEKSRICSNWQARGSLDNFLKKEGLLAVTDVDTRTLAVGIRDGGDMWGIISKDQNDKSRLLKKLKRYKKFAGRDFLKKISVKRVKKIKGKTSAPHIAVLDLGITNSLIKQLQNLGCNLSLWPYNTKADRILKSKADGLIISSGPEEDASFTEVVEAVKEMLGKIPMLGISAGHEIIGLALGGKLKRMKIGHRGLNYPVKAPNSYKGEITVQNHSLVVDEASLRGKGNIKITLRNLNDDSIEEMTSSKLKFISVQYYPVSPVFNETNEVFGRFLKMVK